MSNASKIGDAEPSSVDIIFKVLSAAKTVGLSVPVQAPAPVDGVWALISQSQQSVSVPVAGDYVQMLGKARMLLVGHLSSMLAAEDWLSFSMLLKLGWRIASS